jgi:hypothetical protein
LPSRASWPARETATLEADDALDGELDTEDWSKSSALFFDAFNPTLTDETPTRHGAVVPGIGWFDDEVLGIGQGPIVLMIENHRSGLI